MKLTSSASENEVSHLFNRADKLCKAFDKNSNCYNYLNEKLNATNTKSIFLKDDNQITGIAIIEIIDKYYGNLIVHTDQEDNETDFAALLIESNFIGKNILELIQFRSNFNYRDEFINRGLREKERMRMWHQKIEIFEEPPDIDGISFIKITPNESKICGDISFQAHKHRLHIECYDVYSSAEKRTEFANDLREKKHGQTIDNACLIMKMKETHIGLIEIIHVKNFNTEMGWIMDVALLPDFQGMGLGKHLIKKSIRNLYKLGYSAVGLGVTLSNKNAHQLYKSMGFEDYEYFVEIIGV